MKYKAVIVNYNKSASVNILLRQLGKQTILPEAVVVIDNSPSCILGELAMYDLGFDIEVIHHPDNIGYSRACNEGSNGEWDYIAFLNPDIEIQDEMLFEKLFNKMQCLSEVGCAGVAQRNPDGTFERVARKFPSIPAILGKRIPTLRNFFSKNVASYLYSYPSEYNREAPPLTVDWLQSSFLVVPRCIWQICGKFEERFFVFMADTEYGLRCKKNGFYTYLFRDLQVEADGLRSSEGGVLDVFKNKAIRIHLIDALRYFLFVKK